MDEQKIKRLIGSFSRISGLKVALMDSRFRGRIVIGYEAGEYCTLLHTLPGCLEVCLQSNLDAFEHVKSSGELYLYRCPFGLSEAVAPIKESNAVVGYLVAGPILESEKDSERFLYRQAAEYGLEKDEKKLREAVEIIRKYSNEEIRAYSDMFSVLAMYIGGEKFMRDNEKSVGQLVKDYVKRNLSRKITLEELSMQVHCCTVTLTEHFRREFGMSVMQYVMKKRMALAEELLLNSKLSVTDIACRCGFCDTEYFSRCFKRAHGICPSEFRRKCK